MKKNIEIHLVDLSTSLSLPYADEGIRAGFPSPAQDYMEQAIDLNKELIKHPSSTFYGRVVGDSMKDEGIEEGDILVIDSINGKHGHSVKLAVQGQGTGWKLKQEQLSKHHTTDLGEIIEINCK